MSPLFIFSCLRHLSVLMLNISLGKTLYIASFLIFLLCQILGPDSGWQPIPLTDVITSAAAKKAYRKATLCVHPDKLQQRGASIQHKYICEKVFDLLKVCLACRLSPIFLIYFNHVHTQFGCGTILYHSLTAAKQTIMLLQNLKSIGCTCTLYQRIKLCRRKSAQTHANLPFSKPPIQA